MTLSTIVISKPDSFFALERDWQELWLQSSTASVSNSFAWAYSWWQNLAHQDKDSLKIACTYHDNILVALVPLSQDSKNNLSFIGCDSKSSKLIYPEHTDLLFHQAYPSAIPDLLAVVADTCSSCRTLDFGVLSSSAQLLQTLTKLKRFKAFQHSIPSAIADLSSGFESYIEHFSTNSRQRYKKLLRFVAAPQFCFEVADNTTQALNYFGNLCQLHAQRWSKDNEDGVFSSAAAIAFHKCLISRLSQKQQVVISQLSFEGQPIAVLYGFISNGRFEFYQCGVRLGTFNKLTSPGVTTHLLNMKYLAGRGIHSYDFLAGENDYKTRLASSEPIMQRVRAVRLSLPAFLSFGKQLLYSRLSSSSV